MHTIAILFDTKGTNVVQFFMIFYRFIFEEPYEKCLKFKGQLRIFIIIKTLVFLLILRFISKRFSPKNSSSKSMDFSWTFKIHNLSCFCICLFTNYIFPPFSSPTTTAFPCQFFNVCPDANSKKCL